LESTQKHQEKADTAQMPDQRFSLIENAMKMTRLGKGRQMLRVIEK